MRQLECCKLKFKFSALLTTNLYQQLLIFSFSQCLDQQVSARTELYSVSQSVYVVNSLVGGEDYGEINAALLDVFLFFDENNRRQSFNVTIVNDSTIENTENFTLELRLDPFDTTSNVLLTPNVSMVSIIDDDEAGMTHHNQRAES